MKSWIFPIALYPKDANKIGEWDEIAGYLRLPKGLGPPVRGAVSFWDDERLWYGVPDDVAQAIQTVRQFVAQEPIEDVIVELQIRIADDDLTVEYRYLKLSGEWSEWLIAGELLEGPQGVQGDRFRVYGERDAPNSFMTLYRQLQAIDPQTSQYTDVGEPEEIGTLWDGWVHVGFYMPYMVDNEDGTLSLWRQWYCRVSAQSNEFLPEGEPEEAGSVELPVGPPGGYYLISSTNPADHVAYFWREYYAYNPVTQEYEASGVAEQIGGVVAPEGPPGPIGPKGDYYVLLADNPPESTSIVRLFRQKHSGVTNLPIADPEQIGTATAIQGPPGAQGIQGPPGTLTAWTPFEDYINSTEWQRVSWIAHLAALYIASSVEATTRLWSSNLGMGVGTITAAASIVGLTTAGPFGLGIGVLVGLGAGLLAPFADAALMATTEAFRDESDVNDMAMALYCSLLGYRDWSTASLESWVAQYEGGNAVAQVSAYEHAEAVQTLLAQHWREIGLAAAQEEIAMWLLRYEYDPLFDYTPLPCTPVIPGDFVQYDFTIDEQGWYVTAGGQGEYVAGQGWGDTVYDGSWHYITVGIDWGGPYVVTYFEVLYDMPDSGSGQYVPFWQYVGGPSQQNNANPEGNNLVWSENAPNNAQECTGIRLYIPSASPGGAMLRRVSITFDGDLPP